MGVSASRKREFSDEAADVCLLERNGVGTRALIVERALRRWLSCTVHLFQVAFLDTIVASAAEWCLDLLCRWFAAVASCLHVRQFF